MRKLLDKLYEAFFSESKSAYDDLIKMRNFSVLVVLGLLVYMILLQGVLK